MFQELKVTCGTGWCTQQWPDSVHGVGPFIYPTFSALWEPLGAYEAIEALALSLPGPHA